MTEISIDDLKRDASPMTIALFAALGSNLMEAFYLSRLGIGALATFSYLLPFIMIFESIGVGLGAGAASVFSRSSSFADRRMQKLVSVISLVLALLIAVALCLLSWLFRQKVFTGAGAGSDYYPAMAAYLSVWLPAAPLLVVNMVAYALLRAKRKSRLAAQIIIAGAALNVLLAPLFIFGVPFLPAMGMPGAALAQLLSCVAGTVMLLSTHFVKLFAVAINKAQFAELRHIVKRIMSVSIPASLSNFVIPLGAYLLIKIFSAYGTATVASYGIAMRLDMFALAYFLAYSSLVGPFYGRLLASQNRIAMNLYLGHLFRLCLKSSFCLAFVFLILRHTFPYWLTSCTQVLPILNQYYLIVPISYGAYGLVMIINASFNGLGKPLPGLVISFMRSVGLLIPAALVLGNYFERGGVFVAIALSNLAVAAVAYLWFRKNIQSIDYECPTTHIFTNRGNDYA